MRALIQSDEITQKIKAQVAWAERPENWYYPEKKEEPPGDNPAFTMILEVGFRVVFSITVMQGQRFRYLSISVEGTRYPHPTAAFTIATLFGFTGGVEERGATIKQGNDWMMQLDEPLRAVVIAQEIPPA